MAKIKNNDRNCSFLWSLPYILACLVTLHMGQYVKSILVSSSHCKVLENTIKWSVTFYLVQTTILNYNWVDKNIHTHTLGCNIEYIRGENQKFKFLFWFCFCFVLLFVSFIVSLFVCFFLFSLQRRTKRKLRKVAKSCARGPCWKSNAFFSWDNKRTVFHRYYKTLSTALSRTHLRKINNTGIYALFAQTQVEENKDDKEEVTNPTSRSYGRCIDWFASRRNCIISYRPMR